MSSVRLWALGALLAATGCFRAGGGAEPEQPIPFEVMGLDGAPVRSEDLRGRYVLLDFWATWCPPCVLEIPELNAVYERFRNRGVEVLAISADELPIGELSEWADENGVAYPIAVGSEELARRYGAFGFPFHVLLSPQGTVLEALTPGFHDREELSGLVERHISG